MLFSEVIGQQLQKGALMQAVDNNQLSHALLFLTPEGAGGLPMAMALAQYLVCTDRQEGDSCGKCAACKKASQLIHPDIHYTYPVIPKKSGDKPVSADYAKEWREFIGVNPYGSAYQWSQYIHAENKQGNIPARECSQIIHRLGLKSYESDYKIMIIWHAEALGKEGNRLLKSLEEPPDKTVFILVASQASRILNTILSRTQLVRMPHLAISDLKQALLKGKNSLSEQEAQRIAALSEGSYNAALHLLKQDTSDYMKRLRKWLNAILSKKPDPLSKWLSRMAHSKVGREQQKQFLQYFVKQLEYSLRMEYIDSSEMALLPEEETFGKNMLKLADFYQIKEMVRLLEEACYHIERNANSKILFHALSLRLRGIFKGETVHS